MRRKLSLLLAMSLTCAAGAALLSATNAMGARWNTCNGSPVKWRGTVRLHRNGCSIADTGIVNGAYWNGNGQWDRLSNVIQEFRVNSAGDCVIHHGDGQNEVGLVNRSEIDGNNGLTVYLTGICFIGSNSIDEADVMVANDLNFIKRDGDFRGTSGRSTFVHEFGHFFGFLHEEAHAIMRPSPPHLVTGGQEPHTNWAGDTIGMERVYGFATHGGNLLPSALGVVNGAVQQLDPYNRTVCRGNSTTATFYLSNAGNVDISSYRLRIRLSSTSPPAGYSETTNVVAGFYHALGSFTQGTFEFGFRVPTWLQDGTYNVYMDMDYDSGVTELREHDNTTISALSILVNC